jgi:uncharacterized membrane protein YccC
MAVALAPLALTCAFIIAQPGIGPLGLLSAVYFSFASSIDNVMTYDAAGFLNTSFAILLGIAVAVVLFATFFPETPPMRVVVSAGSFLSTWATSLALSRPP